MSRKPRHALRRRPLVRSGVVEAVGVAVLVAAGVSLAIQTGWLGTIADSLAVWATDVLHALFG